MILSVILLNLFMSKNEAFPKNFTQHKFESLNFVNDNFVTSADERKIKRNSNSFLSNEEIFRNKITNPNQGNIENVDYKGFNFQSKHNKLRYKETKIIKLEKQGFLSGIIREFPSSSKLESVDQFLGIPYAEAPINSKRFMPPSNPLPWKGDEIFRANKMGPVCPQKLPDLTDPSGFSKGRYEQIKRLLPHLTPDRESEDCLYLNLYVRNDRSFGKFSFHHFSL
jgi:hypothetical protein